MYQVPHFIQGKQQHAGKPTLPITNPATGQIIGQVGLADKAMVDHAVAVAEKAFEHWSLTPPLKRCRILFKFKTLLEEHLDELAEIVTREHGKTLDDARGSIQRGIDVVEFACGMTGHLQGKYTDEVASQVDSYSIRQPLGVCVGITPFNFPAMIPLWMFPIAIACGNTFILKPSEKDPSCSVRLAELATQAGLPDGVLNIVQGDKVAVDALLAHPAVKAISSVGSTPVAQTIYKTAASYGKRVQAFGGAKNHCLIMPDADLDEAADAIVGAAYGSAGERCMALSVVLIIGEALADAWVEKMKQRISKIIIGPGDQAQVNMGPLISKEHDEKVRSYLEIGLKEGANLVIDGRSVSAKQGFFLGPCLFDHVKPSMRIYQEEIFGPVLSLVRVSDMASAIKLINDHPYGNGVAIFTNDGGTARTFAKQVEVGMVGINVPIPVPIAYHSFGGWKQSMFGDVTMHGVESIQFFTRLKTITQRWLKKTKGVDFLMPTH